MSLTNCIRDLSKNGDFTKQSRFIFIGFVNALIGAIYLPVMSLYVYQHFSAGPFELSIFLGLYACMSIVYTHFLSVLGERKSNLKSLGVLVCIFVLSAFFSLTIVNSFWVVFALVVVLLATYQSLSPIIMGLAHANFPAEDMPSVNSKLVAATAAAWVFGPSISFLVVKLDGFNLLFYCLFGATVFLLGLILFVPYQSKGIVYKVDRDVNSKDAILPTIKGVLPIVVLLIAASFSVALYQHLLPIYFANKELDIRYVGWAFTFAALIEVVVILMSNKLAIKIGFEKTFLLASIAGFIFFLLLPLSVNILIVLLALQLLKAMLYGLVSGCGINWLQVKIPEKPILSATLFHNGLAIGSLLAGFLSGLVIFALPTQMFFITNVALTLCCAAYLLFKTTVSN